MTTVICTEAERDLILAGTRHLVIEGDMPDDLGARTRQRMYEERVPVGMFDKVHQITDPPGRVVQQRWVDAPGPCPTCADSGWPGYVPADVSEMSGSILNDTGGAGLPFGRCPERCIDGRKRVALAVTCPEPFRRHIPPCPACNNDGSVVFAHATVEVLPVPTEAEMLTWLDRPLDPPPDHIEISDTCAGELTAFLVRGDDERDPIDLNPLPVPGRDWIVALDNVELAQ